MGTPDERTPITGNTKEDAALWTRLKHQADYHGLTCYVVYVAAVLCLAHISDNMDRLVLGVVNIPLSQALKYGDMSCLVANGMGGETYERYCTAAATNTSCGQVETVQNRTVCEWDYNGSGYDYELLVGPVYYVVFTISAVICGLIADITRRTVILAISAICWSLFTILTGMVTAYWQLLLLRLMLAAVEATCTPMSASLLGDYFADSLLATAIGAYNWGTDIGYSVAFAVGNFAVVANLQGEGWRWAFYICGIPGIIVGLLILFTIREPARRRRPFDVDEVVKVPAGCGATLCRNIQLSLTHFLSCDVFTLCLATAIRKAATYSWIYNVQLLYEVMGDSASTIGVYLSWIPLVGGGIGLVVGGFVADQVAGAGRTGRRIIVIVLSQILAIPFALASLYMSTPLSYYLILPYLMLGELWLGVSYATLVELVPSAQRTTILALFVFVVENIAGLGPVLVTPLQAAFEQMGATSPLALKYALSCTFPGGIALSVLFYLLSYFATKNVQKT